MYTRDHTIAAVSTAQGGAISVVRMSGDNSLNIVSSIFSKKITEPRKCYFGNIINNGKIVDEVIVSYYKNPHSYTGEDMVEISCHGSSYVTGEILRILVDKGAVPAGAGEFTQRAFLNGKMNLSEAEAVADLIASENQAAAEVALSQMRGGYSKELSTLREKLLHIESMLELELDFSEEDVEFASRDEFRKLLTDLKNRCDSLASSFSLGNVLKNGIPVAIIGKPNVGKSTLLNTLVGSDRSIVSEIAGTTRDFIDETICIDGVKFRFIDTAGIRSTNNEIEAIGVERSLEQIKNAKIVINMADSESAFEELSLRPNQFELKVINKSDSTQSSTPLQISAKYNLGIDFLKNELIHLSGVDKWNHDDIVVSNARHYDLLKAASSSVAEILDGIDSLPSDIISHLLREALQSIGAITGEFTTDEVLQNIFSHFCIGK